MPTKTDPSSLVRALDPEVILRSADLCDGHSILAPEAFIQAGLPIELVEQLTVTHESDTTSPKSTIFHDGQPVASVRGVYGLDLLVFLAGALGVTYPRCIGRGFQASAIKHALFTRLRSHVTPSR
ncbi:MAG: hypothetical protein GC164_16115 [Phycisphaera sp.]|nr:hypothetical protein [Phycisphaera sp.]